VLRYTPRMRRDPEPDPVTDMAMADAPQPLPADFWEQPEIRAALASRHFGRFLRVYRASQSPRINQADAARWLGITQGQLSKIERSSLPVTDLSKLCRWAQALHVPADLLWFSLSPVSPEEAPSERVTVEVTAEDGGSHVHRRELFKVARAATAVAYTGLLASSPWQRLIDCVEHSKPVDAPTVRLIQDRTADFYNTEETVPARELLDSLTEHLTILQAILPNAHTEQIRHELEPVPELILN
jgi:transcriptional regulator with XRE-family HTH domain